ncbi:MAG: hypothetical protein R2827_09785 [Bdellovibrionales bacterium]
MHAETPHLPVLLVGRSASSSYLMAVAAHVNAQARERGIEPFVIDYGNANMLPEASVLAENRKALMEFSLNLNRTNRARKDESSAPQNQSEGKTLITFKSILDFMFEMHGQIDMQAIKSGIVAGDRHLLVTSERDPQVLDVERQAYAELEKLNTTQVAYIDFKGTEVHDYFSTDRRVKEQKITAFKLLYSFLRRSISGESVSDIKQFVPSQLNPAH